MSVSGNWRMTFCFDNRDAILVDDQDDHWENCTFTQKIKGLTPVGTIPVGYSDNNHECSQNSQHESGTHLRFQERDARWRNHPDDRLESSKPHASHHARLQRLVYIVQGQRVVGFDNEHGKGDHCHLDGKQLPYEFSSLETLIEDFIREVEKRRK